MKQPLLILSCAALLVSSAASQFDITLIGRVVALQHDSCNRNATHAIDCTDVQLFSSTVDLAALEGRTVALSGRV